jgi:flavodoxin I
MLLAPLLGIHRERGFCAPVVATVQCIYQLQRAKFVQNRYCTKHEWAATLAYIAQRQTGGEAMVKIGVFYGSKRGDTRDAAEKIQQEFDAIQPGSASVFNVKKAPLGQMAECDKIVLGSSSWEEGSLQEHWMRVLPQMDEIDLSGKQVAVFGLGDQYEFGHSFQGAIGVLANKARERGAQVVGYWPTEGYDFSFSSAVEDGHFLGLALDNANQYELTEKRIKTWVEQVAKAFGIA